MFLGRVVDRPRRAEDAEISAGRLLFGPRRRVGRGRRRSRRRLEWHSEADLETTGASAFLFSRRLLLLALALAFLFCFRCRTRPTNSVAANEKRKRPPRNGLAADVSVCFQLNTGGV